MTGRDIAAEIARVLIEDDTLPSFKCGLAETEILRRFPAASRAELRRGVEIAVEIEMAALPEERRFRHDQDE